MNTDLINRIKQVKLLLLDVDGVLTDGTIIYHDNGDEIKIFNVKDGLGLRLLMDSGIQAGIVTGRASQALLHRCKNLGINLIFDKIKDKASVLDIIVQKTSFMPRQMAFMGDDLPDLPLMRLTGISAAVADAHEQVRKYADIITVNKGGHGAVRELCEIILDTQGFWDKIKESYINS
ncbi:3-deoxy-D-manno-octulosonate 8-phosphatase [Desulfonema limicola]|uniref:3-deoxy-D-manno-octulosonate 8-phosphatase n=1 Tax=Desulfonema limicola TaxID=45656 RepID=A0A975B4F4_9BACT|nr:HAD hydrolase family protein [Desulfonema limicola]QTA78617.1 3-deoxy-D-manno-octulosonate 8-phosphatase [Desulfonema limicola]